MTQNVVPPPKPSVGALLLCMGIALATMLGVLLIATEMAQRSQDAYYNSLSYKLSTTR